MTGRNDETDRGALAHLITEQDVHAYVDDELAPSRREAVERFLRSNRLSAEQASQYLRANLDLRAARRTVYADDALQSEVERLMAKRRQRSVDESAQAAAR